MVVDRKLGCPPTVSVIVPVYDVAPFLKRCADSVLNQSFQDLELILVNDGSTDGSCEMCDAIAQQDARVEVVHRQNGGLSRARNSGLDVARGTWILFLDGDDVLEEEALAKVFNDLPAGCEVVVCNYRAEFLDGRGGSRVAHLHSMPAALVAARDEQYDRDLLLACLSHLGFAWNKLYSSALLRRSGARFPESVTLIEDVIFNCHVLNEASAIAFCNATLVRYIHRPRVTLGSVARPDYLDLRSHAAIRLKELLCSLGASPDLVERRMSLVRREDALRFAQMLVESNPGRIAEPLRDLRRVRSHPLVQQERALPGSAGDSRLLTEVQWKILVSHRLPLFLLLAIIRVLGLYRRVRWASSRGRSR